MRGVDAVRDLRTVARQYGRVAALVECGDPAARAVHPASAARFVRAHNRWYARRVPSRLVAAIVAAPHADGYDQGAGECRRRCRGLLE